MRRRTPKLRGFRIFEADQVRLELNPDRTVKLRYEDKVYPRVKIVLCRPLYDPDHYASVQTTKHKEIGIIRPVKGLRKADREVVQESLLGYYLTCRIKRVVSLAHQFGAVYWSVETDKGPREFVIRGISEHVRWLADSRLLITDVDGNRFEIPDMEKLDKASQNYIDLVL